ncbi:hypothetical protein CA51_34590 [Rosistilla oblonga]|uniref:hypothetical protein n=1 Tax=Rosistilla oblonga TaxID=2527990 RepID=UPI00118D1886|nr:hypothetical protein [Rosistilla oblonga]QDV13569.1 hypothetical protein CA51_34590 [Rosistilla oblonga]
MIRIVMLDFVGTLVRDDHVLPHVPAALNALRSFVTADGDPLEICLIADPAETPQYAGESEADFFERLGELGLRQFFEPVEQRVVFVSRQELSEPNARWFHDAIDRLEIEASPSDCLMIAKAASCIAACKSQGIDTLRFGDSADAAGVDFSDWSDAPDLVALRLGATGDTNSDAILAAALEQDLQLSDVAILQRLPGNRVSAAGNRLHPVNDPALGDCDGVSVYVPVQFDVRLDGEGKIAAVDQPPVTELDAAEAAMQLKALVDANRIAGGDGDRGKTHRIETQGEHRVLKRIRFQ